MQHCKSIRLDRCWVGRRMRNFVNLGCENMQDVGGTECKFESWGN